MTDVTIPQGENQRLRYAFSGILKSPPGATESGSARGNVRDSDNSLSLYGNKLYNWLVHFDKPVEEESLKDTMLRIIENLSENIQHILMSIKL